MKIAISTSTPDLNSLVDPRFGRAPNFVFVDIETEDWEAYPNPGINAKGGAGVQAAQFIASHSAQAVISGDFGPNAYSALAAAGVEMFLAPVGEPLTARELLARYRECQLQQVSAPTNSGHHAPRGGRRGVR